MLRLSDMSCGYDGGFILNDINLAVNKGEIVGIIGPNGSGKTTLIRALTRVLKPQKGEILFNGRDIWRAGYKELAKEIAVVSQQAETGMMSVEDFVLLGRIPHLGPFCFMETEQDHRIAQKSMILTDTLALKEKLMSEMSGGERQLAFIARALAQEPRLLLLDEPTAHLDITHQVGILDLIKRLNKELGLTVMMVLHDLNLASEYCDRLLLLHKGGLYKSGRPQEVLTYPIIEEVYNTVVVVEKNPLSQRPYILVVTEEERQKGRS